MSTRQIYSKLAMKTPERYVVLLLLTFNIFHFFLLSILLNLHKKKCLLGLRNGSFRQCVFSNWEKYIVLWAGKTYLAICFHSCPRLQKDKFSQWHFKKISRTLAGNKCNKYIHTKYKVRNHFITEDMLNAVLIFFYKNLVFFRFFLWIS